MVRSGERGKEREYRIDNSAELSSPMLGKACRRVETPKSR